MQNSDRQIIEQTLLDYCRRQGLFAPGDRVIAACSGGADSMALLLFLLRLAPQLGITVQALHVNHGLRAAAEGEEAFVADFCRSHGVPLYVCRLRERGEIPPAPSEDWARRARYACFDECAAAQKALVATAHTVNDQAETLLLRLARGTGLHGAGGIAPRRGPYRRPLLCLTREQTEGYCRLCGQSWVEDASNHSDLYARNRLRRQALPALQSVNKRAACHLANFCENMQEYDEYFMQKGRALLQSAQSGNGYKVKVLASAEPLVLRTALWHLVGRTRDPEQKYVRLLCTALQNGSGSAQLTPEVCWQVKDGLLRLAPPAAPPPVQPARPFGPGEFSFEGGFAISIRVEKYENLKKFGHIHKKDLNCVADYDKIQTDILVRTRLPGDFFAPAGRSGTKTLKKLFNEQKIPPARRALLPLIAHQNEVLWLWGFGFARGLAPGSNTRRVVVIEQHPPEEEVK